MPEMVKQLVEVPKTISQNRIQQRTAKQIVDNPVVQVPRVQVVEKIVEIPQLQTVEKIAETPQTQTIQGTQAPESLGITPVCQVAQTGRVEVAEIETSPPTESASAMFVSTPVPQAVEELVEASKAFSQNRVQQSSMEQIIANPAMSLAEKTVEMPVARTIENTRRVVNTHVQQVVQQTVDIPSSTDSMTDSSCDAQMQVPTVQVAQKTVREIRSKFEVEHTSEVHARNRSDKNRWREKQRFEAKQYPQEAQEIDYLTNQRQVLAIRSIQKTVEVPRVQYIDKVADIPVDVQRQGFTNQAPQYIDEVLQTKMGWNMRTRRGSFPHQPKQSPKVVQTSRTLIGSMTWFCHLLKAKPSS